MRRFMTLALVTVTLCLTGTRISWADAVSEITQTLLMCPAKPEDCRPKSELVVKVIRVRGVYAKASIAAVDGSGETDIAYLKKMKGKWLVLDQGTGVNPYELGIPQDMW
jgi:hypothetical protein